MTDPLPALLVALSLLIAAVATVYVVLDRPVGNLLLGALGLLEGGLLVLTGIGIAELARGEGGGTNGALFVAYLVGTLLFVPVAAVWALGERSRAGTAGLIVLGLVVPVLILRLEQIWTPGV